MSENLTLVDWRINNIAERNFLIKPKANEKSSAIFVYCKNIEKCNIVKNNFCLGLKGCPYAKIVREKGYTKRAKENLNWIQNKKNLVKDVVQKRNREKLVLIDEYVFFDYPYWNFDTDLPLLKEYSEGFFSNHKNFIKKEHFNVEFLKTVLKRKPRCMMGDEILSYQKEEVPKIKKHLKEEMPELYNELISTYPELKLETISNIKRKALLSTVVENSEFKESNYKIIVKKGYILIKEYKKNSLFLRNIKLSEEYVEMKVNINKDDYIVIQNDNQWDENTIFLD